MKNSHIIGFLIILFSISIVDYISNNKKYEIYENRFFGKVLYASIIVISFVMINKLSLFSFLIIEIIVVLVLILLDKVIWKVNVRATEFSIISMTIKRVIKEVLLSEWDINDGKLYLLKDGTKVNVDLRYTSNYVITLQTKLSNYKMLSQYREDLCIELIEINPRKCNKLIYLLNSLFILIFIGLSILQYT